MIQILGWICNILIAIGFLVNSRKQHLVAIIIWIIADAGGLIYDYYIKNWPHAALVVFLVCVNIHAYRKHSNVIDPKLKEISKMRKEF